MQDDNRHKKHIHSKAPKAIEQVPSSWRRKGRISYKGRKAWIPPEAPKGLRVARLGIPADLTLGSIGSRSLHDIAGMEVRNVSGSFLNTFTTTNQFDQCIQRLFSQRFSTKSLDSLGNST